MTEPKPTNAEIVAHHLGLAPQSVVNALVLIGVDPHATATVPAGR